MNSLDRPSDYVDPRIVRTRQAIADAFLRLLRRHRYEHITVTELTKVAKVGPKTFHRHYKNLDALLTSLFCAAEDELRPASQPAEDALP